MAWNVQNVVSAFDCGSVWKGSGAKVKEEEQRQGQESGLCFGAATMVEVESGGGETRREWSGSSLSWDRGPAGHAPYLAMQMSNSCLVGCSQ